MIYGRVIPSYPYNIKAQLTRCTVAGRHKLFAIIIISYIPNTGFDHLIPTRCKISPLLNVVVTGEC